jgi:hypothetical protein
MTCADFGVIKSLVYPIEKCHGFEMTKEHSFHWMTTDVAYLHLNLYIISLFYNRLAGRPDRDRTTYHLGKAISSLNKRLTSSELAVADSTAATIMTLSIMAAFLNDADTSRMHMDRLRQIFQMRGGTSVLQDESPLLEKIIWQVIQLGAHAMHNH